MSKYKTPQEEFWATEFGDEYISRNNDALLVASATSMFSNIIARTGKINSAVEFGCNIGLNLSALRALLPRVELHGIEINEKAAETAKKRLPESQITQASIVEYTPEVVCDLAFICGVMIHLNPDVLPTVYEKIHQASSRFVLF